MLFIAKTFLGWDRDSDTFRSLETLLGILLIWLVASLARGMFFHTSDPRSWRAQVPRLLVDLVRFAFVIVGGFLLFAGIWKKDLTPLLATFGVGSIVLGLALQDTLGNFFAGLAIIIERPFGVGEWVQIGNLIGKISQINWRAARLITRELDEVTVPNSVLTKETIKNFSRPVKPHGVVISIGYAYDHAPNTVKESLLRCARSTRGVLTSPPPEVRVNNYAAYAIDYEVKFYIIDYEEYPTIRDDFMTQVWYANKRRHLIIPFPIQTEFHSDVPIELPKVETVDVGTKLKATPLFAGLTEAEIETVKRLSEVLTFAAGERVVDQGLSGESMFVIVAGKAIVTIKGQGEAQIPIAALHAGDYFGEMSFLTGEARSARVTADLDLTVIEIPKHALAPVLADRQEIIVQLAKVVETRREELKSSSAIAASSTPAKQEGTVLLQKIRKFFGL